MSYSIKEAFKTLQGEGAQAGRAAVFCRFAGCNLWSGRDADRADAVCQFCDTDFVGTDGSGGGKFARAESLAAHLAALWGPERAYRYVVFTGGEPLLQLDAALITAMKSEDFTIAVETNGSLPAPDGIDWICVSPKAGAPFVQRRGHELKLVFPQSALMPESFETLDADAFGHYWLQPMDGLNDGGMMRNHHTAAAVAYCQARPRWRLSLQTHKMIGIP
jgi:7-carboxy-7-deazaguanine synthase